MAQTGILKQLQSPVQGRLNRHHLIEVRIEVSDVVGAILQQLMGKDAVGILHGLGVHGIDGPLLRGGVPAVSAQVVVQHKLIAVADALGIAIHDLPARFAGECALHSHTDGGEGNGQQDHHADQAATDILFIQLQLDDPGMWGSLLLLSR